MGKKRLVTIVAAIGVLLVLLIAAPYLINVNNYRPTIEAALGSSLGRQAQIGHLRLSLLSRTLTAEDISISDDVAFGHSPFLLAKSLAVGVEVLPLVFSHTLHVRSLCARPPASGTFPASVPRKSPESQQAGSRDSQCRNWQSQMGGFPSVVGPPAPASNRTTTSN
jgi:hypothetical protein